MQNTENTFVLIISTVLQDEYSERLLKWGSSLQIDRTLFLQVHSKIVLRIIYFTNISRACSLSDIMVYIAKTIKIRLFEIAYEKIFQIKHVINSRYSSATDASYGCEYTKKKIARLILSPYTTGTPTLQPTRILQFYYHPIAWCAGRCPGNWLRH